MLTRRSDFNGCCAGPLDFQRLLEIKKPEIEKEIKEWGDEMREKYTGRELDHQLHHPDKFKPNVPRFVHVRALLQKIVQCSYSYVRVPPMQVNADMNGAYIGRADYRTWKQTGGYKLDHAKSYKTLPFNSWTGGCKVSAPLYGSMCVPGMSCP